jgi:NitT/TauT family transport system permease protein
MAALWDFIVTGDLFEPLGTSLTTFGLGMAIAIGIGCTIGLLMGVSPVIDAALGWVVNAGLAAPVVTFVPLFILLFGIGSETRVATVVIFALWVIIVNVRTGIRSVNVSLMEMAESFGASRWQVTRRVRFPGALPFVMAGLRLGTARGVKGLITGEVLVAIAGLGGLVQRYGTVFSMDRLYALIFFLAAFSLTAVWLVERLTSLVVPESRAAMASEASNE